MTKDIYTGIKDLLIAVKKEDGTNVFKEVAWFNHQYDRPSEKHPYQRPAVFIEFLESEAISLGNKVQKINLLFKLHIVSEDYICTPSSNDHDQEAALEHLDLLSKSFKGLQGKSKAIEQAVTPPLVGGATAKVQIFNTIKRTKIIADHDHDNLIVTIQEFSCLAFDYAAVKTTIKPTSTPKLNIC